MTSDVRPAAYAPMGFTAECYPVGTHMCLIYDDDRERRRLLSSFLGAGLSAGEQVAYFADTMTPAEVREWLGEFGIYSPDEESDQLVISEAEKIYCPEGRFVPDEMLDTLRKFHDEVHAAGRNGRVSGEMSWALRGLPGSDRLMEYEARVNDVLVTHPVTAICQYDARRFDGAVIFDVLKVHPMMIVHGHVTKNPYYLRSQEFLCPSD